MQKAYERAAKYYQLCNEKSVLNERVEVDFIKGTDDFWFTKDIWSEEKEAGVCYETYNFEKNAVAPLFDHEKLKECLKEYVAEEIKIHK